MTIAANPVDLRLAYAGPRRISRALIVAGFAAYAGLLAATWWTVAALLPDHLTLHLAGHAFVLRNIHDKLLGNAALILLILPSVLWLECVLVGWEKSSFRALLAPTASMKTDMAFFLLDQAH